ncbi:hypothetical protein [Nocardia pneumoniae]|uniref:hypothetical protein n=1 Tax=Nocardia pneumoniae TaxID=228601 RepID=UPI0003164F8B|nr:hypothetical protein [Nocardia pneumoniae]
MAASRSVEIAAWIGGRQVERDQVLAWEDRRIDAAARKLGVSAPEPGDIDIRREALLHTKLELGSGEIRRRLARDSHWADRIARAQARVSRRRRHSVTELEVSVGSAADFAAWFDRTMNAADPTAMLRACPDHFDTTFGTRGQEVLETTGSSPLAALFFIDYDDVSSLLTPPDASFPYQIAGVARAQNGRAIGGVRHQFRDTATGFHARLTVEFPLPILPTMVAGHRWHLACEFSNWIEAATQVAPQ